MRLTELVAWLDDFLRTREVGDDPQAWNGLQVENDGEVRHIAVAVDACQAVFDKAAVLGADLLLVHHGLFWGADPPITGRRFRRIRALLQHGVAVYSSHLPLDLHPDVGNNVLLAGLLGVPVGGWWGEYRGERIGVWGDSSLTREEIGRRLGAALGSSGRLLACGPDATRRIGIVTGAGGSMIAEAHAQGIDTLITGEGKHHSYFDAEELGVNVFYAGHYATETLGVRALGDRLAARFGLPCAFIDHPTGL